MSASVPRRDPEPAGAVAGPADVLRATSDAADRSPREAGDRPARDAELGALLARAADGDGAAFESFYDRTWGYAEVVGRRLLRGPELEDLLADVYFEAWRQAARFDPGRGSAVTWLLNLVRSRAIDRLRLAQTHPSVGGADGTTDDDRPAESADPVEALWLRQAGAQLHAALAALNPAERWALGLAYFRDCSHGDIARITGWPLGTVKSVLLRSQDKLRRALAPPNA